MNKLSRILILLFVIFTCVGCDQAAKSAAETHLRAAEPISYLNNTVRLEYAENPGAFLSLGAGLSDDAQWPTWPSWPPWPFCSSLISRGNFRDSTTPFRLSCRFGDGAAGCSPGRGPNHDPEF